MSSVAPVGELSFEGTPNPYRQPLDVHCATDYIARGPRGVWIQVMLDHPRVREVLLERMAKGGNFDPIRDAEGLLRKMLDDMTGYAIIETFDELADAMKAAAPYPRLYEALHLILIWLEDEKPRLTRGWHRRTC